MKKIFAIIPLLLFIFSCGHAQKHIYVQAGLNSSKIYRKESTAHIYSDGITKSYHAGAMAGVLHTKWMNIETGLLLSENGQKFHFEGRASDAGYTVLRPLYLDIPINISKAVSLTAQTKLIFEAGPYAAIGLSGNAKYDQTYMSPVHKNEKIIFSDSEPSYPDYYRTLHRMDYGINIGFGVQVWKVFAKVNRNIGLRPTSPTDKYATKDNRIG
jgi:hypothetical protein